MDNVENLKKEIEFLKEKVDGLNTCDGTLENLQEEIDSLIEELVEINKDLDIKNRYHKACMDLTE